MTFTGKITDINEALSWVAFTPAQDYLGTEATLTITTDDQGYLGTGGAQQDTDLINLTFEQFSYDASPTWTTFPAALDSSFGTEGMQTLSLTNGTDFIHEMRQLDNGKILAVGAVDNHLAIMRFNPDMTLDTSFGNDGFFKQPDSHGRPGYTFDIDKQNRIIVGSSERIYRYHEDGTNDTTFADNGRYHTGHLHTCLLYTSPSPRDQRGSGVAGCA